MKVPGQPRAQEPTIEHSRRQPPGRILPAGTQTSSFWIDESGSKTTAGKCFVVAGIKTRCPDDLQRSIKSLRERYSYTGEFKFSRITERNLPLIYDLIDVLEASDARIMGTVVDGSRFNPFTGAVQWEAHAKVIARLVVGNLNRNEVAAVIMDGISTPPGCSLGRHVKRGVNSALRAQSVVQAFSLDSQSNDLLQAADLVAGAVFNQRHGKAAPDGAKARAARRLALVFGVPDLQDHRSARINIATLEPPRPRGGVTRLTGRKSAS